MRTRMFGGVRGRKTKIGGKPTFVFLLLDYHNWSGALLVGAGGVESSYTSICPPPLD